MKIRKRMGLRLMVLLLLLMVLLAGCSDPYEECERELIPRECLEDKKFEIMIYNIFDRILLPIQILFVYLEDLFSFLF